MKKVKKLLFIMILFAFNALIVYNVNAETYPNNYKSSVVSCGDKYMTDIPAVLPKIIRIIYMIIQIAVPVVLVVIGLVDLLKSISAQKEEDIKKTQQIFIKRLITAVLIFISFVVVKLFVSLTSDNGNKIMNCAECFLKNKCGG